MERIIRCIFILLAFTSVSNAQKYSLSGHITDSATGETLIGAAVYLMESQEGTRTNNYGFYSIPVSAGVHTIRITYPGYNTKFLVEDIKEDKTLEIQISVPTKVLKEIVITDTKRTDNFNSTDLGKVSLSIEKVKALPAFFGEVDMLKTLQLMPGIKSAGEGSSGFYVRGGGPDQNLILLDDAVVYNPGHLFGFFSVFNGDALKNTTLIKGSMPANYGGRLSSVVDVSMKDGNNQQFKVKGGLGLLASRLSIEGPLQKNKSSFMICARRTYIDFVSKLALSGSKNTSALSGGIPYYFYDLNVKANYTFSPKDKIFLSGYFGKDVFNFKTNSGSFGANIPWGNATGTLRWNHVISNRMFINTTAVINAYNFKFEGSAQGITFGLKSGVLDKSLKTDWEYYTKFNHTFKAGIGYTFHKFIPNVVFGQSADVTFEPDQNLNKFAHDGYAYLLDEFSIGEKIKVNAGLRYGIFSAVGPFKDFVYSNNVPIDSTVYTKGQNMKTYGGLEPRLNVRWETGSASSLKLGVTKTYQYLHLVSNNGSTLPTDLWVPSGLNILPQSAWQYSLGYFQNLKDNMFETSIEVYYKDMKNQLEYRNDYTPNTTKDIVYSFVRGNGWAYGAEFFVNKSRGRWTGWIGYTLSWTKRQFDELNNGEVYFAKYDRRHDISIVSSYELNKKWTLSAVFVYATGSAITLPTGIYSYGNSILQDYSKINQYRLPYYQRLDFSAIYKSGRLMFKKVETSWAFSIYNVLNRQNPYIIFMENEGSPSSPTGIKTTIKQLSIFPILPSVTWNFSF